MTRSIELINLFALVLALMTLAAFTVGAVQRERRTLFWIFAGMFGFMSALTAIVTYFVVQALPQ